MVVVLQSCTATYFFRKIISSLHLDTIELLRLQFSSAHSMTFNMWVIYHPPASSKSSGTSSDFFDAFECLLTEASVSIIPMIIVDDFNVHFHDETKSEPLRNLLESFSLL